MTRTFAYRCGGSDGIAKIGRTVFPFNPLTEQSEGHLQTRGAGWSIYAGLSRSRLRNGLCVLPELIPAERLTQFHLLDFTGGRMRYCIYKLDGLR